MKRSTLNSESGEHKKIMKDRELSLIRVGRKSDAKEVLGKFCQKVLALIL